MSSQTANRNGNLNSFLLGSPLALSAASLLLVAAFIRYLLNRPKKLDLPVFGGKDIHDHRDVLFEGVAKYPNSPFLIETTTPIVVLPIAQLNEVRNLPENQVSFMKDVINMFAGEHTGIGVAPPEAVQTIMTDLTRHIASTLDDLQEEIVYGFDKEFGKCEDWTAFPVYSKVLRVVALLSSRVFVGRPLSREEEWINASINYTLKCNDVRLAVQPWPQWTRPFVVPFLPAVRAHAAFKKRGGELLKPILEAQMANEKNIKITSDESDDVQGTFLQWLLARTPESRRHDEYRLSQNQMDLSFAAIHTTSMATTAVIYDLAAYPEYIPALREEIQQVMDEDGYDIDGDGYKRLKKSSIPRLWRLDSFLKESQRLTPPSLVSNTRVCVAPVTLSTGHTLPAGTRFCVPSWVVHNSSTTPSFASQRKSLTEFDGLRFYDLRHIAGNENKHQFVATSSESLNFGHGNHACPGRFFASNEIKVVLIHLLMFWEIRFEGGGDGKGERPGNYINNFSVMPNPMAKVELRRRKLS